MLVNSNFRVQVQKERHLDLSKVTLSLIEEASQDEFIECLLHAYEKLSH